MTSTAEENVWSTSDLFPSRPRVVSLLVYASIVGSVLPYVYARTAFKLPAYLLTVSLFILVVGLYVVTKRHRFIMSHNPYLLLYVASILVTTSVLALMNKSFSLLGVAWPIGYAGMAITSYSIFPLFFTTHQRFDQLAWVIALVAAVVSMVGFVVAVTGTKSVYFISIRSVFAQSLFWLHPNSSLFYNPNVFGPTALIGMLSSLYLWIRHRASMFLIVTGICGLGILSAQGRAAMGATAISVFCWLYLHSSRRQRLLVLVFSAISGVIGLAVVWHVDVLYRALLAHGLNDRVTLWSGTLDLIVAQPYGYGFGPTLTQSLLKQATGMPTSPHNSLLSIGLHFGIQTVVLYLLVVASSLSRILLSSAPTTLKEFLCSTIAGLFFIFLFSDHTLGGVSFVTFTYTLLLGIANFQGTVQFPITNDNGAE